MTNKLLQSKRVDNIVLRQLGEQEHAKRRVSLRILTKTNHTAKKTVKQSKIYRLLYSPP